jgi:hypothetical protein
MEENGASDSPSALARLIKQPMVRYFVVTGILAFIAVIMLIIHCIISQIEHRRSIEQDRKLSFGPAPSSNSRLSRQSPDANTSRKMAFPFMLRSK